MNFRQYLKLKLYDKHSFSYDPDDAKGANLKFSFVQLFDDFMTKCLILNGLFLWDHVLMVADIIIIHMRLYVNNS